MPGTYGNIILMSKIGVLTSGGDSPGMNAAIRSVVRSADALNLETIGFMHGYQGLIDNQYIKLNPRSVANTIQRGGTWLKTARCKEFYTTEGRIKAFENLKQNGISKLVCIGGDGTFSGAHLLHQEHGTNIFGIPGTIDNDISGTELTLGFDSAVNTAIESIDRIRDTADSHDRIFFIEVMGRDSSFIAIDVAISCGAEGLITPEYPFNKEELVKNISASIKRGKKSSIYIVAEGETPGKSYEYASAISKSLEVSVKVCVLGHVQRGGAPSAKDRIIGSEWGAMAVEKLSQDSGAFAGVIINGKATVVNLEACIDKKQAPHKNTYDLIKNLSR